MGKLPGRLLAVGVAVAGLYLAGTLSGALTEDEPVRPKMSGTVAERTDVGQATVWHTLRTNLRPNQLP